MSKKVKEPSKLRQVSNLLPIGLTKLVSKSFFRNVKVVGQHNIPKDEPVIICANHSNQFMDAINLFGHISTPKRPVKFLIAGVSYRKPIVGHVARLMNTIPVERAQDLGIAGVGKITSIKNDRIRGVKTEFKRQAIIGGAVSIRGIEEALTICDVVSDEEIIIKPVKTVKEGEEYSYKILPKLDQSEIYNAVSDCLNNNELIGIFPEGGSSDRTDLLPLKAGVCIMALEAMIKYNRSVNIVCCGLNYFKPHKFRSRVIIEVGVPFKIPLEFIDEYKQSRRNAISKLLQIINQDMRSVIYPAPSYQELVCILLAKKIYVPRDLYIEHQEDLELNKRFTKAYDLLKDKAEVQQLLQSLLTYRQGLKNVGITDRELKKIEKNFFADSFYFVKSLVVLLVTFSFALPGLILNGPVGYVLTKLSEKERIKCLKASGVKVKGNDVVASYQVKIGFVFLPLYHCFFSSMLYFVFTQLLKTKPQQALLYSFIFFYFYPFYSYCMLKASDRFVKCFKNIKARFLLIFSFQYIKSLKDQRNQLKNQILGFVAKYFEQVCGKEEERIIPEQKELILKKRRTSKRNEKDLQDQKLLEETFSYLSEIGI